MPDRTRPPDDGPEDTKAPPDAVLDLLDADDVWRDTPEAAVQRATHKRQVLEASLERGKTMIRLDARRAGVRVPKELEARGDLALNVSWRFPDTNMVVNERGLAATLRFGGVPFRCVVPWSALWGIAPAGEEKLRVWPADIPTELGGPPRAADTTEPPPVEPVRPRLSVVAVAPAPVPEPVPAAPVPVPEPVAAAPAEPMAEAPAPAPEAPETPEKPRAPWLRLVK